MCLLNTWKVATGIQSLVLILFNLYWNNNNLLLYFYYYCYFLCLQIELCISCTEEQTMVIRLMITEGTRSPEQATSPCDPHSTILLAWWVLTENLLRESFQAQCPSLLLAIILSISSLECRGEKYMYSQYQMIIISSFHKKCIREKNFLPQLLCSLTFLI